MEYQANVLDHGFVRLVDVMGNDSSIVQAARVSYGAGTKSVRDDEALINYLLGHWHTTPFEMPVIRLHIKCPIFVARQWFRHRMASYNEESARYSEMSECWYTPAQFRAQDTVNKQGSAGTLGDGDFQFMAQKLYRESHELAWETYQQLLSFGVAREQARAVLPLSMYTEFYVQMNLHNLLHFLRLRLDSHAQYEIRVYAEKIAEIVKLWVPVTWKAFENFRLYSMTLSGEEIAIMQVSLRDSECILDWHCDLLYGNMSKRARNELDAKFAKLGLPSYDGENSTT
jgi:thymidylate synthase (FAD)